MSQTSVFVVNSVIKITYFYAFVVHCAKKLYPLSYSASSPEQVARGQSGRDFVSGLCSELIAGQQYNLFQNGF